MKEFPPVRHSDSDNDSDSDSDSDSKKKNKKNKRHVFAETRLVDTFLDRYPEYKNVAIDLRRNYYNERYERNIYIYIYI